MEQKKMIKEAMRLYEEAKETLSKTHELVIGLTAGEKKLADKIGCGWEINMDELSAKECVGALYIACISYAVRREVILKGNADDTYDKLRSENQNLPTVYYWLGDTADLNPTEDIAHMHSAML